MDDLISRKAAIKAMKCINDSICEQQAIDALCELPTAEQKKGQWIEIENEWGGLEIICSECRAQVPRDAWGNAVQSDYCYRCGADMRGEDDERSDK